MMDSAVTVPKCIKEWLAANGYADTVSSMGGYIAQWYNWAHARGDFYDKSGTINGRPTKQTRMSIRPAMRVCNEWASLLLNEDVRITTENEAANEWLSNYLDSIGFIAAGQGLISKAFSLGTAAWALWFDLSVPKMQLRRYDARMILPLSYDDDGIYECAFYTKAVVDQKPVDQAQIHVIEGGTYHIKTKMWHKNKPYASESIIEDMDTLCAVPSFAIIRPAIDNTCVDMSPFGQSIYADAIDAIAAVDQAYDAIQNEAKLSKMRVFIGDLLLESTETKDGSVRYLPFGDDDVIFRKVTSNDQNLIEVFAPQLRSQDQIAIYRDNWRTLGDLTGFGKQYFDPEKTGGLRTATEVSADNSALMRNIHKHENVLKWGLITITQALINGAVNFLNAPISHELGTVKVIFDDSIISDTASEKAQAMLELDRTLNPWEYRMKWYGETEEQAKANVPTGGIESSAFAM